MALCSNCNKEAELKECKIIDGMGKRYRSLCDSCIEELSKNSKVTIIDGKGYSSQPVSTTSNAAPLNNKSLNDSNNGSINTESINGFDIVLKISTIRRLGLISIICAILNPIVTFICGIIGNNMGDMLAVPYELKASLEEAVRYNRIGKILSFIMIVIDVIIGIIVASIYS